MRKLMVGLFLLAGCKDECVNYARVACGKVSLCEIVPGARYWSNADEDMCVEQTLEQMDAAGNTDQEMCLTAKQAVSAMNCTEFRALWSQVVAR